MVRCVGITLNLSAGEVQGVSLKFGRLEWLCGRVALFQDGGSRGNVAEEVEFELKMGVLHEEEALASGDAALMLEEEGTCLFRWEGLAPRVERVEMEI